MRSYHRPPGLRNPDVASPSQFEGKSLDIEVGCGVGWHAINYCRAHPERFLIAIERTQTRFSKFSRRLENHSPLPNLIPVHSNAMTWIPKYIGPQQVENYFFLYPNPHPKSKQRNQRWHAMPLMGYLIETLKPHGTIHIASNIRSYIEEAIDFLTKEWKLNLVDRTYLQDSTAARTHFEKKYLERGELCQSLCFRKPN